MTIQGINDQTQKILSQIEDPDRGFSFLKNGPLNMNMGKSKILARDVINKFSEKQLAEIFYNLGNERYAK